jgi:hypothetical protein
MFILVLLAVMAAEANPFLTLPHVGNLDIGFRLIVCINQVSAAGTPINAHGLPPQQGANCAHQSHAKQSVPNIGGPRPQGLNPVFPFRIVYSSFALGAVELAAIAGMR